MSFDLAALVDEAIQALAPAAPAAKLVNAIPPPFTMKAHPGAIERITTNLMRNASQAGATTVTMRASRPLPSGIGGVVIDVIDDGPGLPPELRQRLFEPFAAGRKGGTGLGLAIVRDLVQAHNGSVRLADAAGAAGAHFRIELPRA